MAIYYAVATGNWSSASTWASSSGGAGGAGVPTSADDAVFDASSGSANVTADAAVNNCKNFTTTGFTGTITITNGKLIKPFGNVTLSTGWTLSNSGLGSPAIQPSPASGNTCTWTSNGKDVGGFVQLGTGTVSLADSITASAGTSLIQVNNGTFVTNNNSITSGSFISSTSNTRTLTFGSSSITITASGTSFNCTTGSALTVTTNTATVTQTGSNANFATPNRNWNGLSLVQSGSGTAQIISGIAATFANYTRTGTATLTDTLQIFPNLTITGTFTINGNSVTNRLLVSSTVLGTQLSVTAATVVASNVDIADIVGLGVASWNLSAITGNSGDCGGNSGITFTSSSTQTATGTASFNWSTHGWTTRVPLPQDDVVVSNAFVSGRTVTIDMPRIGRSIDFSGLSGNPTITSNIATGYSIFGSLTLGTIAGNFGVATSSATFAGRSSYNITFNGQSIIGQTQINCPNGTYTLQDAAIFSSSGGSTPSIISGTLDTNNQNVTFSSAAGAIRVNGGTLTGGTSILTITGTNATPVNITSGTVNLSNTTIVINSTSVSTRTFAGNGNTFGTLTYTIANSPGTLAITGANSFTNLNIGSGRGLTMPGSTTNTITNGANWNVNGTNNGYIYMADGNGINATTPDSTALSIVGDLELRVRMAPDVWNPTSTRGFISKADSISNSYRFFVDSAGKLNLALFADGTTPITVISSTALSLTAVIPYWFKVTWRQSDGKVQFFYSADNTNDHTIVSWTQVGIDRTISIASIFDGTSQIVLGALTNAGGSPMAGKLYRALIFNGIGGTIALDADFSTKVFGVDSFTEGSTNAATITLNGLATVGDGRVALKSSSTGTAATISATTGTVSCDYLTIKDITASTTTPFYAGTHSINISNNTNWSFTSPGININAVVATCSAAAGIPTISGSSVMLATLSAASAMEYAPVITGQCNISAVVTNAQADFVVPLIQIIELPLVAPAQSIAIAPNLRGDSLTLATLASALAASGIPSIQGNAQIAAVSATANAASNVALIIIEEPILVATAQALALAPTLQADSNVVAVVSGANALALAPIIQQDTQISSVIMEATATLLAPLVTIEELPASANSTAQAIAPTLETDCNVVAVATQALAQAIAPAVSNSTQISTTVAQATTQFVAPTIVTECNILAQTAIANAAMGTPTIDVGISIMATIAQANAQAIVASFSGSIKLTSLATNANAQALVPNILTDQQLIAILANAIALAIAPVKVGEIYPDYLISIAEKDSRIVLAEKERLIAIQEQERQINIMEKDNQILLQEKDKTISIVELDRSIT